MKILTKREREILYLLSTGHGNNEIADRLYVSRHTIKTHLYNLYKKLGVTSRLQAAMFARKYIDSLRQ